MRAYRIPLLLRFVVTVRAAGGEAIAAQVARQQVFPTHLGRSTVLCAPVG